MLIFDLADRTTEFCPVLSTLIPKDWPRTESCQVRASFPRGSEFREVSRHPRESSHLMEDPVQKAHRLAWCVDEVQPHEVGAASENGQRCRRCAVQDVLTVLFLILNTPSDETRDALHDPPTLRWLSRCGPACRQLLKRQRDSAQPCRLTNSDGRKEPSSPRRSLTRLRSPSRPSSLSSSPLR